jgi:RHS repeat-associated protein
MVEKMKEGTSRGTWLLLMLTVGLAHAGTRHYYYTDPQGTVLAKTDAQGNIIATYDYAPYGQAVANMSGAPNGPGYTGHVNDPETGLVYMQARYYDPDRGGFLSVDPVTTSPGNLFSFNRYDYGNNNPIVNIDPDGRKVLYQNGVTQDFKKNFALSILYLNSVGGAENFAELQASKDIFYVGPSSNRSNGYTTGYDPNSNTIQWADKAGLLLKDAKSNTIKVGTPALALGHEAEHAVDDMKGTYHKDRSTSDKQYGNKEEKKVIEGYENGAAGKLGEPVRKDHYGHGNIPCATPIKC